MCTPRPVGNAPSELPKVLWDLKGPTLNDPRYDVFQACQGSIEEALVGYVENRAARRCMGFTCLPYLGVQNGQVRGTGHVVGDCCTTLVTHLGSGDYPLRSFGDVNGNKDSHDLEESLRLAVIGQS